jgi:hypothetical protein
MQVGYRPDAWHDLFVVAAGSSAALTGLLFVAVSIHLEGIARHPALRYRAAFSLYALLVVLLVSGAMIAPNAPNWLLGVGTGILGTPAFASSLRTGSRYVVTRQWSRGSSVRTPLSILLWGAWIYAGASIAMGWGGGLLVLVPLMGAFTVWAVVNCWELVMAAASVTAPHEQL